MQGAAPLGSKSSDLAPHSPSGGLWPPRPPRGGRSAPPPRGVYLSMRGAAPLCTPHVGAQLPHPQKGGRSAPPPRVTFSPMRKSPKNLPEGTPLWVLPKGDASLPLRRGRNPLDRVCATKIDRFATFRLWANRSCFSPLVLSRRYFLLSIRGAGVILPRRNPYYPSRRRWPDR